jgi:hypothetical protein
MSKTSQAFVAADDAGNLAARVQIARAVARALIARRGVDADPFEAVDELAGGPFEPELAATTGDMWTAYGHHISAAVALGIAIGQLIHPDLFKTVGAR